MDSTNYKSFNRFTRFKIWWQKHNKYESREQTDNAMILLDGMKLLKLLIKFKKNLSSWLESLKISSILKALFSENILDFALVGILFSGEGIDEDPILPKYSKRDSNVCDTC